MMFSENRKTSMDLNTGELILKDAEIKEGK